MMGYRAIMASGRPGGAFGAYASLNADHLWAASNYTAGVQFNPIRGAVALAIGTGSTVATVSNVAGMNNRPGAAMLNGISGYRAFVGAVGASITALVAYNSLQPVSTSHYCTVATAGGGSVFGAPAAYQFYRASPAGTLIVSDSTDAVPATARVVPGGDAAVYPMLALITMDGTNITSRVNQITKTTIAHANGSGHATADTVFTHGYSEPAGSSRCNGDHFMEMAVWKRVLSDAEATQLLTDRAAYYGITLGA